MTNEEIFNLLDDIHAAMDLSGKMKIIIGSREITSCEDLKPTIRKEIVKHLSDKVEEVSKERGI
ncbi:MAG: hypothetical protein LKH27_08175 [Prevotella sp.]|jgi:hypothetical protein|nr:hypothetical protein [Prevotella sp.]MCH3993025.1 hypothetical protein [Prevotella sp.]MCI1474374.1 hypothetical protein [Prevotella sp.]